MKNDELCPCRSGKNFDDCCGAILSGVRKAATAVELMRARYAAYAVGNVKFLYESSGPELQAEFDEKTSREWSKNATWGGLDILSTDRGGVKDEEGYVEFIAHYSTTQGQGRDSNHHEVAYFKKLNGEWRFIDGEIQPGKPYQREAPKIGRNDPCPCGSGKKFKKCTCAKYHHGKAE